MVDVRREQGNAQLLALGNVGGYLHGGVQHGGHQGRHILLRIVALEVSRLIGHHGIAHRVGFVEGIVGKIYDLIVDRLGRRLGYPFGNGTADILTGVSIDENLALLLNDLQLLLGNGPPDIVCLTHGVTAQVPKYLDNLLLVDNAAVGHLQDRLQQRRFVGDLGGIQLVRDESRNRVHGAGAVEGHNSGDVFDGAGLHIDAHAGHTGGFHLKNALSLALGEHGKGFRVIVRHPIHSKIRLQQLDLLFRVLDHRQVPQSQKVHFQQSQLLDGGHGVLGDNGIVVFA